MYLREVSGVFCESAYQIVSNYRALDGSTIVIIDAEDKEIRLYELESIKSVCTVEELNDLLELIKMIWESEYPDYNIKYWRTKSNEWFLKWLGVENFKNYC